MTFGCRCVIIVVVLLAGAGGRLAAVRAATPAQVEAAIQKGKQFLYQHQQNTGLWESANPGKAQKHGQWGGLSALATYALLAAEESPQDEKLRKSIEFLKNADIEGIYALGLRAQLWGFLPQKPEIKPLIKRDGELLVSSIKTEGAARGMYNYPVKDGITGRYDHSVSQYGVLGLWAVAQCGYEVPTAAWEMMDHAWREHQDKDGGWGYIYKQGDPRASMTAAGVATLFITQDYLHLGKGADCKGNIRDDSIEKGLKWMEEHFKSTVSGKRSYYTLYGIERIGVASGRKYFGTTDWYDEGADHLVKTQQGNGSWGNVSDTCFAMLFLVRGRAPVVMNKLEYQIYTAGDKPKPANWNERPRDCANLVRWMGKQLERDLNWQIVNLRVPIDDLHDAPILYIAGNQNLVFSDAEEKKLRLFVEQGGMILGNADCGSPGFAKAFETLGTKLFGSYEFRTLPKDHIFFRQPFSSDKWKLVPQVRAMTNGARELMVLFPTGDFSKLWQLQVYGSREEGHQLPWNIYLYAVDKKAMRYKGETYIVHRAASAKPTKKIAVARLEYGGNWNPEPGGWRRLDAIMANQDSVELEPQRVKLGSGKLTNDAFKIAHLTGTGKFKLDEAAQSELKRFVEGGGTLVVDSCGGNSEFSEAAEQQLAAMFGAAKPAVLKADHPVYTAALKIKEVGYRNFAKRVVGNTRTPRLAGIEVGNRTAVYYSAEDLSAGLVGQAVDGIYGYEPQSATDLMRNILIHASGVGAVGVKPPGGAKADPPKPADPPKADPGKTKPKNGGGKKGKK